MVLLSKNKKAGFSLIEMLIFIFILTLVSITFYKLFVTSTQAMGNVRHRLDALALANEKMEVIHNLNYEDVGIKSGIPVGKIDEYATAVKDSKTFSVHTSIINVDDPFDGLAILKTDANPADYKQVKIEAYWDDGTPSKKVSLVSNIVPPGLESIYTGGILSIHLVDNSSQGIPGASVKITNNALNPVVNTTLTTDSQGNLFISQAIPANQSYNIQISKTGYFPVQTNAPYPISSMNPVDVDATVVGGTINQKTLVTDKQSSIKMHTRTPLGVIAPNIDFGLSGGKQTGNTVVVAPSIPSPVWAYNSNSLNSGASGDISLANMSSGQYSFAYGTSTANSNFVFLGMDAATTDKNSFSVMPGVDVDRTAVVADKNVDSLWLTVVDNADGSPVASAVVRLKKLDASYDVTLSTNKFGQVYFPDPSFPLVAGDYELSISATGYLGIAGQALRIDKLTTQEVKMIAG